MIRLFLDWDDDLMIARHLRKDLETSFFRRERQRRRKRMTMGLQSQMKERALSFPRQWEDVGAIRYASLVQPCGYCHPCCKWILQFRMQCIEIIIFLWWFGSPRSESKTLVRPALEWTSWEDGITVIWWDSHIERIWKMCRDNDSSSI